MSGNNVTATGASLTVTFSRLVLPSQRWASLAYFSSIGPTLDGRFKPDIIVPGTTISPYSNEWVCCCCNFVPALRREQRQGGAV